MKNPNINTKLFFLFAFLIIFNFSFSSNPILVTESIITLNIDQTKELYFSFAEGDEIIFNMEMVKGKHIKEIEVIETPRNTILTEFKSTGLKDERIQIRNKGIYKFKFYSSSLTRRVCKIKIFRIPKDENTKTFNTNWKWEIKRDTTYTTYQEDSLVGYQTIKYKETVRELKETKYEEIMLFEKSQKVHTEWKGNKAYIIVDLPSLNITSQREENILAWSYWIGVNQEGQKAYKENMETISSMTTEISSAYTSPLGALALGKISKLLIPQTGEDVEYYFIQDFQNVQQFLKGQQFYLIDQGKGKSAYGRNDKLKKGQFYIGLLNDNIIKPIEVEVKVLAVKEIKLFENVTYNREKEEPQYVTLQKTRMNINETQIRVPVE